MSEPVSTCRKSTLGIGLSQPESAFTVSQGASSVIFTETKTIYVDYSGQLQKAQIDNVED